MRDIRFRAWIYELNKMKPVTGFAFGDEVGDVEVPSEENPSEFECWKSGDEAEIMQYTGLKDKNGKEIYEGDILKWYGEGDSFELFEVKWVDGVCGFRLFWKGKMQEELSYDPYFEVIGNIYQGTDLLK